MASLKTIRKRIASVKSTQQITKAMKLVAASKLRRAQDAVLESRPFADNLAGMVGDVVARAGETGGEAAHPLMAPRADPKKVELLVLTSDRGLCGGFNSNILRRALRFGYEHDEFEAVLASSIGRRGHEFLRRRQDLAPGTYHEGVFDHGFARAEAIATDLADRFLEGEIDGAYLLYNKFLSAISQEVTLVQVLPIQPPERAADAGGSSQVDYEYEPSKEALLEHLLPHYLASQVWQAILESVASEHGARMTAMDSATRNAGDMIDRLTLLANRTRQAAITTELMEIVSGAEALK